MQQKKHDGDDGRQLETGEVHFCRTRVVCVITWNERKDEKREDGIKRGKETETRKQKVRGEGNKRRRSWGPKPKSENNGRTS